MKLCLAADQLLREVRLARAEFAKELANARAEIDAEVQKVRRELTEVRQELDRWRAIRRFRDGTDAEPTWMH
jgi:F0F1-type ATP synthase membrane subunit b/b'